MQLKFNFQTKEHQLQLNGLCNGGLKTLATFSRSKCVNQVSKDIFEKTSFLQA